MKSERFSFPLRFSGCLILVLMVSFLVAPSPALAGYPSPVDVQDEIRELCKLSCSPFEDNPMRDHLFWEATFANMFSVYFDGLDYWSYLVFDRRANSENRREESAALFLLGYHALHDPPGFEVDDELAVEYFGDAARMGNGMAMTFLGRMYEEGRGVKESDRQAYLLYQRAANTGEPVGMFNLGWAYLHGIGIEPSEETANEWFRRALEEDFVMAGYRLGHSYRDGRGVEPFQARAYLLYKQAAERGHERSRTAMEELDDYDRVDMGQILTVDSQGRVNLRVPSWAAMAGAPHLGAFQLLLAQVLEDLSTIRDRFGRIAYGGLSPEENVEILMDSPTIFSSAEEARAWMYEDYEVHETVALANLLRTYASPDDHGNHVLPEERSCEQFLDQVPDSFFDLREPLTPQVEKACGEIRNLLAHEFF